MSELDIYREQLQQVQSTLAEDPENDGLRSLEGHLLKLLELSTLDAAGKPNADRSSSASQRTRHLDQEGENLGRRADQAFKVGQSVYARLPYDGKFYSGQIVALPKGKAVVHFKARGQTLSIPQSQLRLHDPTVGRGETQETQHTEEVSLRHEAKDQLLQQSESATVTTVPTKLAPKLASEAKPERMAKSAKSKKDLDGSEIAEKQSAWLKFRAGSKGTSKIKKRR